MADLTPEERARELTKLIVIGELAYDNSDPYAAIAQTIREAENAAYERAAEAVKTHMLGGKIDIADPLIVEIILALQHGDG